MYRDSYSQPDTPLTRILSALNANFRVGRFFGTEVRMYWLGAIILPVYLYSSYSKWTDMSFLAAALAALITTALLFLIIWVHEMGHVTGGRRYGIHTPLITLSPLGGLAHLGTGAPTPKADLLISFAGPVTHIAWLALLAAPYFLLQADSTWFDPYTGEVNYFKFAVSWLWSVNLFLFLFNLLPFFPLDGGRILRAGLSLRMSPWRATVIACRVGQVGAVGFMIYALFIGTSYWGSILFIIGIVGFLACMQELKMLRFVGNPYMQSAPSDPWAGNPDAWKQGGDPMDATESKRARKRREKAEAEAQKKASEQADFEVEVDRILEKVSQVGMSGLTAKEKKTLMEASRRRQG